MTKEEVKRLKNLFNDSPNKFFDEMEKILEKEKKDLNDLLSFKVKLNNSKKDFKEELITREIYNIELTKLSKNIFSFVDEVAEYLEASSVDLENTEEEYDSKGFVNKSDEEYELLLKFNFTLPLKRFRDLSDTNKTLLPFIIRGEGNYGQKWLYHKLVYDYFERFGFFVKPSFIDFKERNITTFENLLDELCEEFKVENYKSKTLSKKKSIVKKYLLDKMKTTSQILIFKEACSSLANEFEAFYDILLFISDEMEVNEFSKTKCILFLVESEKYQLTDHEEKFIFLSKMPSYKAKIIKELKFIDLDLILPITTNCIEEWLGKLPEHILDCIDCDKDYEKLIIDCDNGHPEKVIPEVCKLINIDFEQKRNLWLTF